MLFSSVIDAVGHTPLVRLQHSAPEGVEVYAKLELQNFYGMKDRVAKEAILEARRTGELPPAAPIIESSSGTMALGVALVGTALGHPVHIVTDPRIDRTTLTKLRSLGCEVHVVQSMSGAGWQSARLELLEELVNGLPDAFWPQQYQNPDNPHAYRHLAAEILADLDHFDVVVGSVGSGGSLCGTSRELRHTLTDLRVVGVDCTGSVLFDQPDRPERLQSGLGNSLRPANLDRSLIDEVHWLNDHEAFAATRDLARREALFAGNTSGSVYQVLLHLADKAAPGSRLVGIFPDRGDRYAETVFDDSYWADTALPALPRRSAPSTPRWGEEAASWACSGTQEMPPPERKLLFIEANTTGTGMLALDQARELGFTPLFLTGSSDRYQGLAERDCEIIECDTNSLVDVRRTLRNSLRRENCAGVTTTSEFYLPIVAEVAEWLDLPGNPPADVAVCRNKSRVRHALANAGFSSQPRFATITFNERVGGALAHVGLPCVVKPVDDSGSVDVALCSTAAEVHTAVRTVRDRTINVRGQHVSQVALLEEHVDGPEYSVEMFRTGEEDVCIGITEKHVTQGPAFVEYRHMHPAPLSPVLATNIEATVRAALSVVGLRQGASHTEVRVRDNQVLIIEINGRPAGGMIPQLIRLASGIDLLGAQLRAAAGLRADLTPHHQQYAGVHFLTAEGAGVLLGVDGVPAAEAVPGVSEVVITALPGRAVQPARHCYDRLGYVIARGSHPAEVREALDRARSELSLRLGMSPSSAA